MLLQNKTAVVTGCNRGIGKKILEVFSANGATVIACVRNINEEFKTFINEIKKKFNNQVIPIEFDLNDESQIKEAASNILSSNSSIDILVNNAATIHTALFQMTSIKKLKEPVQLSEIKSNPKLSKLALVRQSRLSVMPIDPNSWKIICEAGGYN